ncbi:hypothetical protein [Frankia sp. R43]|uniref:hypothetical protein n=1 Tax=Frankia sp. R43 TaxID=269536 RepID=UPI001F45BCE4|nr:hypothetical protein [Frankia sp. R43]
MLVTVIGGGRKSNDYRLVRPVEVAPAVPNVASDAASDEVGPVMAVVEWDDETDDVRIVEPDTDSEGPITPVTVTDDTTSFTPESFMRPGLNSHQGGGVRPQAAYIDRIRVVPDDLRSLAEGLADARLRASFSLTREQVDIVRAALGRVGEGALIRAAELAHKAWDPARFWSAWVGIWQGLTPRSAPRKSTARTSTSPDSSAPAEVPEWALRLAKEQMAGKISTPLMIAALARTIAGAEA